MKRRTGHTLIRVLGATLIVAALPSCNDQSLLEERVEALNQRIDQLEISSEEILVRANSMSELELVVAAMEERQEARMRDVVRREQIAKKRVAEIDAEINQKEEQVRALELALKSYEEDNTSKLEEKTDRLKALTNEIRGIVDLDSNATLLRQFISTIEVLREENALLREQVKQ